MASAQSQDDAHSPDSLCWWLVVLQSLLPVAFAYLHPPITAGRGWLGSNQIKGGLRDKTTMSHHKIIYPALSCVYTRDRKPPDLQLL